METKFWGSVCICIICCGIVLEVYCGGKTLSSVLMGHIRVYIYRTIYSSVKRKEPGLVHTSFVVSLKACRELAVTTPREEWQAFVAECFSRCLFVFSPLESSFDYNFSL